MYDNDESKSVIIFYSSDSTLEKSTSYKDIVNYTILNLIMD